MPTWGIVLSIVGALLVGLVAGFFITRAWFKNYLKKNPPISEAQIREMFRQMGRTASEKQIRQVMASMQQAK
ncbi:MAG: YneF family protein [Candidatus Phytoplasma sp.]|nr:YneF family protein [Phytoplasma sp.]